jgi:magnesium-transporting ATPase (P-type)
MYTSASPDELALVYAAKQFGYEFLGMDSANRISIKTPDGVEEYTLLNTLEFTSSRKRQSSILEDKSGNIILYCKGADNVVLERLDTPHLQEKIIKKTGEYVDFYAEDGLRTLYLAKKSIERKLYNSWNQGYEQAMLSTQDREKKVAEVNGRIETNLTLIGSTAIEDRLQDEVD